MGNEHSKNKELTQNGKIPEKHESGSVNGLSANITLNGLEIEANGETIVQQNGGTHSLNLTESNEPDFVVVESECQQADAPVISEILETTIQREEVKKSKEEKVRLFGKMFKKKAGPPAPPADVNNAQGKETSDEDQTDVSLPATDPQPESGSSEDEAAATIVAEHGEDFENVHQKAETSTQTDRKTEADISTQTGFGDDDDDMTANTEGPVEEAIMMETAATEEDPLNESAVVIAEEAADDTVDQEPFENQTPGMIIEEVVVIENNEYIVYENIVFRAEQVEVSDAFEINPIKNCDPEDESVNETEPEVAAESESTANKDIIEGQAVEEENNVEETMPLEISSGLLKVVADCVEVVAAAVCEYTDVATADTPEPNVEEVFPGVELIETAEPESNAVTPEAEEINAVPSPDEEPVISVMETISEVVCEEPDPILATQGMSAEELSVPLVTEILFKTESDLKEDTADDAVAVTDAPGISVVYITLEAPFNKLTTIEELHEDTFNSPQGEVNLDSIPEVITTDESAEVTDDVIADEAPEALKEENNVEDTVPLKISSSLPKVVAYCVEVVLAGFSEPTEFAATHTSEPSVEEVIAEDNGEGATDMSADEELIETAEHESNAVTPEAEETNGIPSLEEELVTTMMETISEVVCEEPNPILATQGMSAEELSVPLKVESAHEGVTADDAVAVKDVLGISEELVTVEAPSTIEELPEDTANSLDDEVKSESIPEAIITDESPDITEDVIADVGPEAVEEAEPSPVIVKDDAGVIPEAAIDALSQEFDLSSIIPHEATMDNDILLEEEVITATTFVPLSGQQELNFTIPEEPSERAAKDMNEEAIEALSNEFEAVPESVEEDATVQESPTRGQVTGDASSEEPVEENTEVSAQAQTLKEIPVISEEPVAENPNPCEEDTTTEMLENTLESFVEAILEKLEVTETVVEEPSDEQADVPQMDTTEEPEPCLSVQEELIEENVAPSVVAVEEPADSSPVISEEPVEESAHCLETHVLDVIFETPEDEVIDEIAHETCDAGDVLDAIDEHPEDSHIAISEEPLAERIKAVLETAVAEIITEAECNLVACEEVAPEIIAEGETEEKAENQSMNSTDSAQSPEMITSATRTDMEAFLVRLQSSCKSTVEDSAFRLEGLKMFSVGYSITVTIHVAPKEERQ